VEAGALSVALSTVPDAETGLRIARALVEERLIACASLVPGVTSVYRWEGEVRADGELLLVMKTRRALLPRLSERVRELHPYALPEVIGLPLEGGLPAYCQWVGDETTPQAAGGGLPA
jgi:periplasmic divalent cation tolerance protein